MTTRLLATALAVTTPAQGQAARDTVPRVAVFHNVTVVDVRDGRARPATTVIVTGHRISRVAPSETVHPARDAQVVDGTGRWLIPGLIDTHVHLGEQWEQQPADTLALLAWIAASGVTTVRDMGSSPFEPSLRALHAAGRTGAIVAPRIVLAASPTPHLQAQLRAANRREAFSRYRDAGIEAVKILGHPTDTALAILRDARAAGLAVFGHTLSAPGPDGRIVNFTWDALRGGLVGISHVHAVLFPFGASSTDPPRPPPGAPIETRRAWTIHQLTAWQRVDESDLQRLIDSMVAREVWFEPTLSHLQLRVERYDSAGLARHQTWQRQATAAPDAAILAAMRAQLDAGGRFVRRFSEAGGTIVAGSDVLPIPPLGVTEEIRLLTRAGLPPAAALRAATLDAARALGLDRVGAIEEGWAADLVLLDADPLADVANLHRIHGVVVNGRVLNRPAVEALMARVGTPR
jgi:imidazolonepropionase-like amidohydrolase